MKIILATGIYPPDIGGPATYACALAAALVKKDIEVIVVTYGDGDSDVGQWGVVRVAKRGNSFARWWRYARTLKESGKDADAIIAFSSISCGIPLWLSGLKRPKKILRLGGDFFWERYTDRGGRKGLREWYTSRPTLQPFMAWLLSTFDHLVFSTDFQRAVYREQYRLLPKHCTIENAIPSGKPMSHQRNEGFRLLFMGRFVGFKNLPTLLHAVNELDPPGLTLTLVGDGPMKATLRRLTEKYALQQHIIFIAPVHGEEKLKIFGSHDLLILPSITEISPNVALEARASGLPVLLTKETGLSSWLTQGMVLRDLSTSEAIVRAVQEAREDYPRIAAEAARDWPGRSWENVAEDFLRLLAP